MALIPLLNYAAEPTAPVDVLTEPEAPSPIAIPRVPTRGPKAHIVDGKVHIKHIELKGDSLFPQYGVTQAYLSKKLNAAYKNMDPWMTISDMHGLADSLALAYHEMGLTFNQVFVVPNEIEGSTLTINVLPGRVSEIHLKNNQLYSEEQVKAPFMHLLGKVVYEPDIQQAMKAANRIPGLKVFGFFSMGKHPGQVRLNLHVLKETAHSWLLRADNFGVNDTGVHRLIGQYSRNNITGHSDTLAASIVATQESGNLFGSLTYQIPTRLWDGALGASVYSNQFEVSGTFAEFGLEGHLVAGSGFAQLNLLHEDNAGAGLYGDIALKSSVVTSSEFEDVFAEQVDYGLANAKLSAYVTHPNGTNRQSLEVGLGIGTIIDTDNDIIDEQIGILHGRYQYQYRWNAGNAAEQVSSVDLTVHYTPMILPSSERKVMTGPYGVRSYDPALFSADTVYNVALQHSLNFFSPLSNLNTLPFFFIDYAWGEQNTDDHNTGAFLGAGAGIEIGYNKKVHARITCGFPLHEDLTQPLAEDPEGPVIYGQVSVNF